MKSISAIFSVVLAAALLVSCEQAEPGGSTFGQTFRGTIEPATRTTLVPSGEEYVLAWNAGDLIAVSDGSRTAIYKAAEGGVTTTTFTPVDGALSGSAFTAWYPHSLADGILPSTQDYIENDIATLPMYAESGSDPQHLSFRPVSGLLRLNVSTSQSGVALSAIQLSADQPMSGTLVVTNGTLGVTEGEGVVLNCGGTSVSATAKPFYIHIPAGNYTGLTIRLVASDGREFVSSLADGASYGIVRGEMNTINIAATFSAPASGRKAVLRTGTDVNEILKQLVDKNAKCTSADATITKIVFKVNDAAAEGVLISENGYEPVWASFDGTSGCVTISTRAGEIYANVNAAYLFSRLHALTGFEGLEHLNTSETVYFNGMFFSHANANPALTTLDLRSFDTRNAVTFSSMFDSLVNLRSVDVSSFKTANARSFASMFNHCKSLESIDLLHFETGNCETMTYMFRNCNSLEEIDLHTWDLSKVEAMTRTFQYCTSLKRLILDGEGCSTASLTAADYFLNASNVITELRLGKNFNCEKISGFPNGFYQGNGYLNTTTEAPMVVFCTPIFAQKSLRGSAAALNHTNSRIMTWRNIETGNPLQFDQEIGSLTPAVSVAGAEVPKTYIDVASSGVFADAVAQAKAFSGNAEPVIRLLSDVSYDAVIDLTNSAGQPLTLDLNGHTLSGSASGFITTSGALTITDSAPVKGKITSSQSKVINITASGAALTLEGCIIESTKATGEAWNTDAVVNLASASGVFAINNSRIYSTGKLSTLRAYNGSTTINDSELSSGTGSEGWYVVLGLNSAIININSGSFYTSGTGNSSACHIGASGATINVKGGWFYSNGRTVSGGNTYISRVTLSGGYYDREPSTPSSGGSVSYGSGKSFKPLASPVTHKHETTGATLSYGYIVE